MNFSFDSKDNYFFTAESGIFDFLTSCLEIFLIGFGFAFGFLIVLRIEDLFSRRIDSLCDKYHTGIKESIKDFPEVPEHFFALFSKAIKIANNNYGGAYKAPEDCLRRIVDGEPVCYSDLLRQTQSLWYLNIDDKDQKIFNDIKDKLESQQVGLLQKISLQKSHDNIVDEQSVIYSQLNISKFSMIAAIASSIIAISLVVLEVIKLYTLES